MLLKLLAILQRPEVKELLKLLLAGLLGGFASAEIREPKLTAGWFPDFFGRATEPADPVNAIGRISMGNTGCTATITGPILKGDTTIKILTAAHCIRVGQTGRMKLKDGREFTFRCVTRDEASDSAWLIADRPKGKIPFAKMASAPPSTGSKVWHQGYGIHKPDNREEGTYLGLANNGTQLRFRLSVSPGDSGGGIIANASGEVLSPVCCTTRLSGTGDVFGAHPLRSLAIRPEVASAAVADEPEENRELIFPIVPLPHRDWPPDPEFVAPDA